MSKVKVIHHDLTSAKETADMLYGSCPEAHRLYLAGEDKEAHAVLMAKIDEDNRKKWNGESLKSRLARCLLKGKFFLRDLIFIGDKLVVKNTPNCISNSLTIEYTNNQLGESVQVLGLPNDMEAWTLLQAIDDYLTNPYDETRYDGLKGVYVQVWNFDGSSNATDSYELGFKESAPYKHRFNQ